MLWIVITCQEDTYNLLQDGAQAKITLLWHPENVTRLSFKTDLEVVW